MKTNEQQMLEAVERLLQFIELEQNKAHTSVHNVESDYFKGLYSGIELSCATIRPVVKSIVERFEPVVQSTIFFCGRCSCPTKIDYNPDPGLVLCKDCAEIYINDRCNICGNHYRLCRCK